MLSSVMSNCNTRSWVSHMISLRRQASVVAGFGILNPYNSSILESLERLWGKHEKDGQLLDSVSWIHNLRSTKCTALDEQEAHHNLAAKKPLQRYWFHYPIYWKFTLIRLLSPSECGFDDNIPPMVLMARGRPQHFPTKITLTFSWHKCKFAEQWPTVIIIEQSRSMKSCFCDSHSLNNILISWCGYNTTIMLYWVWPNIHYLHLKTLSFAAIWFANVSRGIILVLLRYQIVRAWHLNCPVSQLKISLSRYRKQILESS